MGSREGLNLRPPLPRDPGLGREDPELCAQQDSYTNTSQPLVDSSLIGLKKERGKREPTNLN